MLEEIIGIIRRVKEDETLEITSESVLAGDLDLDSFSIVEIVSEIEEAYQISISDDELVQIKTIQDVIDHINMKK